MRQRSSDIPEHIVQILPISFFPEEIECLILKVKQFNLAACRHARKHDGEPDVGIKEHHFFQPRLLLSLSGITLYHRGQTKGYPMPHVNVGIRSVIVHVLAV